MFFVPYSSLEDKLLSFPNLIALQFLQTQSQKYKNICNWISDNRKKTTKKYWKPPNTFCRIWSTISTTGKQQQPLVVAVRPSGAYNLRREERRYCTKLVLCFSRHCFITRWSECGNLRSWSMHILQQSSALHPRIEISALNHFLAWSQAPDSLASTAIAPALPWPRQCKHLLFLIFLR